MSIVRTQIAALAENQNFTTSIGFWKWGGTTNCLRPQEMDTHHHFPNKHNSGVRQTCFLGNECLMIYSIVLELGMFGKHLNAIEIAGSLKLKC
jgi:hypothetical protein